MGIIALQQLIDPRQMASLKEPSDEYQDWMKFGGPIPWNAIAICETSKTSWQMGKLRTKDDLENHSKDQ